MTSEEFEQLVEEGFAAIPEHLREKVANVAMIIEEEPTAAQRRKMRLGSGHTLLGLYEGIPHTARAHYGVGMTLPDRITIFRKAIEWTAGGDPDRIREIVCDTIWHEIAHHFGMDEGRVRRSEAKRKRKR